MDCCYIHTQRGNITSCLRVGGEQKKVLNQRPHIYQQLHITDHMKGGERIFFCPFQEKTKVPLDLLTFAHTTSTPTQLTPHPFLPVSNDTKYFTIYS